jgi:hypothetical protein
MESNNVNIKFLIDLRQNIEREIETLKNIVSEKEEQLEYITTIVKKDCDHIWIRDSVDSLLNLKQDIPIKYCKKCFLTNNTYTT